MVRNINKVKLRIMSKENQKDKGETKTVIVLGMHRSGTSMVSGILDILGVKMGDEMIGSDWTNPLGHFEDVKIVELNKEILKQAGGRWDYPSSHREIISLKEKFEDKICKLINERNNTSSLWGVKDPRMCLTIDLYLPFLKNPYFVVCHRNLESIAYSLNERNGMDLERSLKISRIYYSEIKRFFQENKNLKKIDLFYEDIIKNPKQGIEKIVEFLDIKTNEEQIKKATNFVLSPDRKKRLKRIKKFQFLIYKGLLKFLVLNGFLNKRKRSRYEEQ